MRSLKNAKFFSLPSFHHKDCDMSADFNKVRLGPIDVHIGKNGITPGLIEHITQLLKQKKIVKIKIMRETAHEYGIDLIIEQLLNQLKVYVLDVRGYTFIISKKKIPGIKLPKRYAKFVPSSSDANPNAKIEHDKRESESLHSNANSTPDSNVDSDANSNAHTKPSAKEEDDEIDFEKLQDDPDYVEYLKKTHSKQPKPLDYTDEDAMDEIDSELDTPEEKIARARLRKQARLESEERKPKKKSTRTVSVVVEPQTRKKNPKKTNRSQDKNPEETPQFDSSPSAAESSKPNVRKKRSKSS